MTRVTRPASSMRMKALGAKGVGLPVSAAPDVGTRKPSTKPAAAATLKKSRLVNDPIVSLTAFTRGGGTLDGLADAHVGPATADVARHGRVDIGIARVGCGIQQCGRRHDLSRLA